MPRPVTEAVLDRISVAIDQLAVSEDLPRTKRSLEHLAGLSHDVVARAFRQDRDGTTAQRLNERFDALTAGKTGRRSPAAQELHDLRDGYRERGKRIAELESELAALAHVVLAQHLGADTDSNITPLRRHSPHAR